MTVGPYHVDVVRSRDAGALGSWIRKHGGRLPQRAQEVVRDYVKDGWCFLVAKLDGVAGNGAPDPLAMSFATNGAVYPMRLTGAQGNTVLMDLYAVVDGTAAAGPLTELFSEDVSAGDGDEFRTLHSAWAPMGPDLNGTKITLLHGEMSPAQMTRDLQITCKPYRHRRVPIADRGEFDSRARGLTLLATGLSMYLAVVLLGLIPASRKWTIAIAVACAVAAGYATWSTVHAGVSLLDQHFVRLE